MTPDLADIECPTCASLYCTPGYCCLHTPRPHPIALTPAQTIDDPDWPGGRPVTVATA